MSRTTQRRKKNIQIVLETSGKPLLYAITFLILSTLIFAELFTKILQSIKLPRFALPAPPKLQPPKKSIALVLTLILLLASLTQRTIRSLPNPHELGQVQPSLSTKIYDREGRLLYKIYKDENRTLVNVNELPKDIILATLAAEDKDFYNHHGISPGGMMRALRNNTINCRLTTDNCYFQGGSTITQQLIKNTLLTSEKTLERKSKEIILALWTEKIFTKDEILQMYLNEVPYGGTAYGIEEAAQQYFGKSARNLTLEEAALLAGLPTAPSTLSPYGNSPWNAKKRQEQVLANMAEEGFITEQQKNEALEKPLTFQANNIELQAPHFVMYVRKYLADTYSEEMLTQGGLEVYTTLDLKATQRLQRNITEELESLKHVNVTNGAGIITNPQTGEILAMVGSRDFFDFTGDGQVNVTLQPRQPGSAIKPITYALAFSKGLTPATTIEDQPVAFTTPGQEPYIPTNYDGKFHGRVSLRTALASSYNIPALKLLNSLGVENLVKLARSMGITTWDNSERFGLALTLGGGDVTLYDLAVVYGVFANNGTKVPLRAILEVKDSSGKILETFNPNDCQQHKATCPATQVLAPQVAFQISDILSDNSARAPAFGNNSVLHIKGAQVAVKTGTSNDFRDNWTIGYTNDILVAAWVGNNDNTPMTNVASGITGASPIWARTITELLKPEETYAFVQPDAVERIFICPETNTRYCNECPSKGRFEYFIKGTEPKSACTKESTGVVGDEGATTIQ